MIGAFLQLAQTGAATAAPVIDWLHVVLGILAVAAVPAGKALGKFLVTRGKDFAEMKLKAAGHDQLALFVDACVLGIEDANDPTTKAAVQRQSSNLGVASQLDAKVQKLTGGPS